MSSVIDIYKAFRRGPKWEGVSYTSEKADYIYSRFWALLISSGYRFEQNDLVTLSEWHAEGYYTSCLGSFWAPGEGHYGLAVDDGNISFARAYEKLVGRKPFICKGISYPYHHGGFRRGNVHRTQSKTQGRLVIGAEFSWKGETVRVTSFNDDKGWLIACSYHPQKRNEYPEKIAHRFYITNIDLKEAQRKERG